MKQLKFDIEINSPQKKVWETMLQPQSYEEWVNSAWPGSTYEGTWGKGEHIKFIAPGHGGTLAVLDEYKPYQTVLARHVAIINANGTEDRISDGAKGWVGITEQYTFNEKNGKTTLTVDIQTQPAWEAMFNDGWPTALKKLKEICER